jgi:hypothetical protein
VEALVHPFFDELRDANTRLPNGRFLPPLFNFKPNGKFSERVNLALLAHLLAMGLDQYLYLTHFYIFLF